MGLYERHRDPVFRFAYRMLASVEAAEDVAHDCFLALMTQPLRFDPARASLRTYLCAAARNLSLKLLKAEGRELGEEALPERAIEGHALHGLLEHEMARLVRDAVQALPPLQREVVVLVDYEDFTLAEAAEVVEVEVDFCRACRAPRPVAAAAQRFPEPRTVTLGDTLAIDLLADERSGTLVTDRVTFVPPSRAKAPPVFPPTEFTPDAVWIQMAEATLHVNGKPTREDEDTRESVQGDVVWTEIPDRGRVFVSLVPRPGYAFEKIGVVAGDRITFAIGDDRYEWISTGPIVTAGPVPPFKSVQSWYVWVLYDSGYRPAGGIWRGTVGAGFDKRAENRLKRS